MRTPAHEAQQFFQQQAPAEGQEIPGKEPLSIAKFCSVSLNPPYIIYMKKGI